MTKARKVLKFRYNLLYACTTTSCIDVNYFASTWKLCQKHGVIHTRGVRWFDFKCKYHFCEVSFLLQFLYITPLISMENILLFQTSWITC